MPTMMDPTFNPGPGKKTPMGPVGITQTPAQRNPRPMPAQRLNPPPPSMGAQPVVPPPQSVGWGPSQAPAALPQAPMGAPQFPIAGSPVLGGGFMNMLKQRLLAAKQGQMAPQGGNPQEEGNPFPIPGSPVIGGNMFDMIRRRFAPYMQAQPTPISGMMDPNQGVSVGFRPQGGLGAFPRPRNDVSGYY